MAKNLVEVATFTANVSVPEGADARTAASVETPFQALANRTKYLKDNEAARFVAATRYLDLVSSGHSNAGWSILDGIWSGAANNAGVFFGLPNNVLPHGSTLATFATKVQPGASRSGSNRMAVSLFKIDHTLSYPTSHVQIGSTVNDDGTASEQTITIGSLSEVIDRSRYAYYAIVTAGNTAESNSDTLFNIALTRTPSAAAAL